MSAATQAQTTGQRKGEVIPVALAASVQIYKGAAAAIVEGTGYGTPLVPATASHLFIGVWTETLLEGTGTAGKTFTRVARKGIFAFNQTGITAANIEAKVYFSDDNTVTLTPGTTYAGIICAVDAAGFVWVDIENAVRFIGGVDLYSLTAPVTTTNVAGAIQTYGTQSIPAKSLKAGDVIRLRLKLVGSVRTSTDTTSVGLYFGSTKISDLDTAFAHATTNFLYADVEFVIRTSGASGTAVAYGLVSTGTAGATVKGINMASATFDTTVAEAFTIQGTFSANNTSDAITLDIFDVQIARS